MTTILPILAAFFLLAGCNSDNSTFDDAGRFNAFPPGRTPAQLRYARVTRIFEVHCRVCHTNLLDIPEAAFPTYVSGSGVDTLVTPGDPEHSGFYRVLRGAGTWDKMPPRPRQPLTDDEIAAMRDWIINFGLP